MLQFTASFYRPTGAACAYGRRRGSGRGSRRPPGSPLLLSYRLASVFVFACFLACQSAAVVAQETEPVRSLERRLYRAVREDQTARAVELLNELAATGDVRAYRAIIKHGLSSSNYAVERQAGKLLVGTGSPEAIRMTLTEAGSNRDYRTRIVLLAVVARWATVASEDGARGEPTTLNKLALQVINDAVGDASRAVALAALKWIGEVNRRESIGPLISHLETLEQRPRRDRLYFDVIKTLKGFSGRDFKLAADWRNWWEIAGSKEATSRKPREPEAKRPRQSKSRTVLYQAPPTFFSVPVDSDRVLFVIDVSQSMLVRDPELPPDGAELAGRRRRASGETTVAQSTRAPDLAPPGGLSQSRERLFRVKKELTSVVRALPDGTRFGIMSFSHELAFWGDEASLVDASSATRSDAAGWVESLQAFGATRTDLALAEALRVAGVDTIYLLTDGAPRDESNQKISTQAILQMVKRQNRFRKCRIHTISFRQVKNSEMKHFVEELARQNDGVCTLLR